MQKVTNAHAAADLTTAPSNSSATPGRDKRGSPRQAGSFSPQQLYELDIREELWNVILRGRFKTNALVRLSGSLPSRRGVLCINAEQIELGNLREFAVARILCEAAKGATARGDPWFVQAQEIVARVQELLRNPKLESKWRYAGAEDVYRVVNSLRGKFKERDLNPLLIESGQRGQGYRLSTPPWNVELLCD